MKNTTHKVVILENFSSPYIHQAIIILKNHTNGSEEKILFEAEKIVSNYIDRNADSDIKIYKKPTPRRKKKSNTGTIIAMSLFLIAVITLIRVFF